MIIKEYYNKTNIIVQFDNEYTIHTNYDRFKKGEVSNPYDKTVYGIGYLGEGEYRCKINYERTKVYKAWQGMLERCYDKKCQEKYPTYKDCITDEEWHNFQNFGKWFDENYYEIEGQRMNLDKDVLSKGNKIYSPKTCVFVPQKINILFIKRDNDRGKLPIGVCFNRHVNKYQANCNNNGEREHLGLYNTPEEAFYSYKKFKEHIIKKTANEYKDKIPQKLYDAMYRYEVEITD